MSKKIELEERRYNIAVTLSVLAFIAEHNGFIPFYLVIFIIFFSSSVTLYLNSRNESYQGENEGRLILLAIMLGVMSYINLMTHINNHIKIKDSMRYCYSEKGVNSEFCDEMHSRLEGYESPSVYDDDYF